MDHIRWRSTTGLQTQGEWIGKANNAGNEGGQVVQINKYSDNKKGGGLKIDSRAHGTKKQSWPAMCSYQKI